MQSASQKNTSGEIELRSKLHGLGMRFRIEWPIPGTRRRADVAFTAAKVAVFVDGCFWHCCPLHATWPKANREWWREKLATNVRRDRDTDDLLVAAGWQVVRVWEHEDMTMAARSIAEVVKRAQNKRLSVE
jgi:DNA mismatch endonuclease, patch repair protein